MRGIRFAFFTCEKSLNSSSPHYPPRSQISATNVSWRGVMVKGGWQGVGME
jgi:hypothetical protein